MVRFGRYSVPFTYRQLDGAVIGWARQSGITIREDSKREEEKNSTGTSVPLDLPANGRPRSSGLVELPDKP
jgi:hypothetical protein